MTERHLEHIRKVAERNKYRRDFDRYMRSKGWKEDEIELMHSMLEGQNGSETDGHTD